MAGIEIAVKAASQLAQGVEREFPHLLDLLKPALGGVESTTGKNSIGFSSANDAFANQWKLGITADLPKLNIVQDAGAAVLSHADGSPMKLSLRTGNDFMDQFVKSGSAESISIARTDKNELLVKMANQSGAGVFGAAEREAPAAVLLREQQSGAGTGWLRYLRADIGYAELNEHSIAGVMGARASSIQSPGFFHQYSPGKGTLEGYTSMDFYKPGAIKFSDFAKGAKGEMSNVKSVLIPDNLKEPISVQAVRSTIERLIQR